MPEFKPEILARWTGGRWSRPPARPIAGFSTDTRRIGAGQMFVALKTDKRDGHDFLAAAEAAGASAALVSRRAGGVGLPQLEVGDPLAAFQAVAREHRRLFSGRVVGITGSAGKTSTKELLRLLLGEAVLATEGNLNNHIGVPLTLTRIDPERHRFAVIEAGISAAGEMAVLAAMIQPDVAIITLVAPAHLEELGDVEGVAREKAALAAAVRPGGLAIFPRSCGGYAPFRGLRARTITVGPGSADLTFAATHRSEATELTLSGGGFEDERFELPPVSDGMAQNAVLALAAAAALGLPAEALRARLGAWHPPPMRGEWREEGGRKIYLDCYNANPAAMGDAIAAFVRTAPPSAPRLFILGSMEELGADSARYHEELGRSLRLGPADRLLLIGTQAGAARAGALAGGADPGQVAVIASVEEAAESLRGFRGAVFIKGSRKYQLERLAGTGGH